MRRTDRTLERATRNLTSQQKGEVKTAAARGRAEGKARAKGNVTLRSVGRSVSERAREDIQKVQNLADRFTGRGKRREQARAEAQQTINRAQSALDKIPKSQQNSERARRLRANIDRLKKRNNL